VARLRQMSPQGIKDAQSRPTMPGTQIHRKKEPKLNEKQNLLDLRQELFETKQALIEHKKQDKIYRTQKSRTH
jgi:hypothetical protein